MALIGKPKDTASLSLFDRPAPAPAPAPTKRSEWRAFMAAAPVTHRFERLPGSDKCFQCGFTRDKHPSPARQAAPVPSLFGGQKVPTAKERMLREMARAEKASSGSGRADLQAHMADPYAKPPKRTRRAKAPPPANVPGSPLHIAPYSTKVLTDGNFMMLQPNRGGWIVELQGEFMGSVKRGGAGRRQVHAIPYNGWSLDPSGGEGGRSGVACRRAADMLEAHLRAKETRGAEVGNWTVEVGAEPNPDFDHGVASWISIPIRRVPVSSYTEASLVSRNFINDHGLGGGNWTGGTIRDASGKVIGHVSYNGRVWDRRGTGAKEIV